MMLTRRETTKALRLLGFVAAIILLPFSCNAFYSPTPIASSRLVSTTSSATKTTTTCRNLAPIPIIDDPSSLMSSFALLAEEKDMTEFYKSAGITLALGGGLIPATIAANSAMFKTMSGKKEMDPDVDAENAASDDSKTTLDPTIKETQYRKYVESSGSNGPLLPFSDLLFATDPIPVADIVAIMGRINDVNSIADWTDLPSTKLPNVSTKSPPQWLPRRAFKVNIRKAKFLEWPNDPKTGQPIGGEELKSSELQRVSKQGALISDAALDAVFDSWAWGASIATPDKVESTLRLYKPTVDTLDLGGFVGAAIRGRSATGFAALTFVVIQVVAFTTIFIAPALRFFLDIDILKGF